MYDLHIAQTNLKSIQGGDTIGKKVLRRDPEDQRQEIQDQRRFTERKM